MSIFDYRNTEEWHAWDDLQMNTFPTGMLKMWAEAHIEIAEEAWNNKVKELSDSIRQVMSHDWIKIKAPDQKFFGFTDLIIFCRDSKDSNIWWAEERPHPKSFVELWVIESMLEPSIILTCGFGMP